MILHAEKKIKLLSAHGKPLQYLKVWNSEHAEGELLDAQRIAVIQVNLQKFRIVEYLRYEKNGKYGDNEQQQRLLQVSDFFKKPKGDANVQSVVKTLKNGDRVRLDWNHNYVTESGRSYPVRTTTKHKSKAGLNHNLESW